MNRTFVARVLLTNEFVNRTLGSVQDLQVIDKPATAIAVLDPLRARILAVLSQPGSATSVAALLELPRQKVNYHLRALEDFGLVVLVEERPRRGLTERVVVASADSYVLSPAILGESRPEPSRIDRLSARYLIALAGRIVEDVGELVAGADAAGKPLATLAMDTQIKFASAKDRAAFTEEFSTLVTTLIAKYHNEQAPKGRWHRLVVAAHPFQKGQDHG